MNSATDFCLSNIQGASEIKGASPPPTLIFLVVARDYISETTVAISMKQLSANRKAFGSLVNEAISCKTLGALASYPA